jgi:hypothetical protein
MEANFMLSDRNRSELVTYGTAWRQLSLRLGYCLGTFVGFSALLFRETIGGRMTGYNSYFTLSFMQAGFIGAAGGSQLLAFYERSHTAVWRAPSI